MVLLSWHFSNWELNYHYYYYYYYHYYYYYYCCCCCWVYRRKSHEQFGWRLLRLYPICISYFLQALPSLYVVFVTSFTLSVYYISYKLYPICVLYFLHAFRYLYIVFPTSFTLSVYCISYKLYPICILYFLQALSYMYIVFPTSSTLSVCYISYKPPSAMSTNSKPCQPAKFVLWLSVPTRVWTGRLDDWRRGGGDIG
jgi:hypothetical protein